MKGVTIVRGDYGNPKGTGFAKITIDNLESDDAETGLTDMDTFVDALVSNSFTECNVGNTGITVYSYQAVAKPAADVNVDDQLVVYFRKGASGGRRKLTIPGIDPDSALLELTAAGKRLTTAGAATLAGLLDTLFGWTAEAEIIEGVYLGKK